MLIIYIMNSLTNKLVKIHEDSENKCVICGNNFKHTRINHKPIDSELVETRFLVSHAKCRKIYNDYKQAKTNYEWAKFEYDMIKEI